MSRSIEYIENLRTYYQNSFPTETLCKWLSLGDHPLAAREFSLTLPNDIYCRYRSYETSEKFKEMLMTDNPEKFDIGAIYSGKLWLAKTIGAGRLIPLEKELVLDIDLTDYDSLRTCCKEKTICKMCWSFISVGTKILDRALREDFGFTNIMWVFSGGRGIHAWVSDPKARKLTISQRRAIISYLSVIRHGNSNNKEVSLSSSLHPHLLRSINIGMDSFFAIMEEQNLWTLKKSLLTIYLGSPLVKKLDQQAQKKSYKEAWLELTQHKEEKVRLSLYEFVLHVIYPRLDEEVSIQLGHLLKSPFCIHPGTTKVCVPLQFNTIADFDPDLVPNLNMLINSPRILDPYVKILEDFYNETSLSHQ